MERRAILGVMLVSLCGLPYDATGGATFSVVAKTQDGDNETPNVYQPLASEGLIAVVSSSSDYSDVIYTAVASAAAYGSDGSSAGSFGVEPMADTRASVTFVDPSQLYVNGFATASAVATVLHRVQPKAGADPETVKTIELIELKLSYNMETDIDTPFNSTAAASISITGPGINFGDTIDGDGSFSNTIEFSAGYYGSGFLEYWIDASAGSTANKEIQGAGDSARAVGGYSQAVADPFLYINSDWLYASLFEVVQESLEYPGTWIEVTRSWQTNGTAPEPATLALFGLGLAGLGAIRRKKLAA